MEELSFNNVMSAEDVMNLFGTDNESTPSDEELKDTSQEKEKNKEITEEKIENPFEEETPESVGDGNDKGGTEVQTQQGKTGSSSNNFSSIASTLKEYGTFEDLSDDDIQNIKDGETFIEAIDKQIRAKMDERQKRIDDALNAGVQPSIIKQYETVLDNLDNISEETLKDESDESVNLRKSLIYQDFINRGYSKERAEKEVTKSMNAGSDIEDALDALESNKQYYTEQYNKLVDDNNAQIEAAKKERIKQAENLRKSILDDEKAFNDLVVDANTRKKIYETITKPVYKDSTTKQQYTSIQKYAMDNPTDFQKYMGLVFTLTNGFKDFSGLVKGPVKKEMKAKIKQMEEVINNSKSVSGSPNFFGSTPDPDSSFPNWQIDV